jgi:hypothetical protein
MRMRGRLVKGSLAAKRYMAELRKLAARKRKANPVPMSNRRAQNPVTPGQIEAAAKKVGYTIADAGKVAADFMRTGQVPSMVSAQLRYFQNPTSRPARAFISKKIGTLRREGRPAAQAAAIAYSMARRAGYRVPRRNQSADDNPQAAFELATRFVYGSAKTGRAGNLYIHGDRMYSYGLHFPIAERQDGMIVITTRRAPSRTAVQHIAAVRRASQAAGITVISAALSPEAMAPAGYANPRRAARNIAMPNGGRCNPACNNPRHGHRRARRNPLLQTVMLANPIGLSPKEMAERDTIVHLVASRWTSRELRNVKNWGVSDEDRRRVSGYIKQHGMSIPFPTAIAALEHYARRSSKNPVPMPNPRWPHQWVVYDWGRKEWQGPYTSRVKAQKRADQMNRSFAQGKFARTATPRFTAVSAKSLRQNPLTRGESAGGVKMSRGFAEAARRHRGDWRRDYFAGVASGAAEVTRRYSSSIQGRRAAYKASVQADRAAGITPAIGIPQRNPPGKIPFRNGQRIPVAKAWAWVQKTGDQELIRQFRQAWELQKKANRNPKHVVWRTINVGDPKKIEMVTAMAHYGDSPETYYVPPKGSKKGARTLFRHRWGEGGGGKRSVPLLASADGKALIMPLDGKKVAGDWLRH